MPRHTEPEMDDEMRFHIEACAADLVRQGIPPAEAMRRARLEFGGVEIIKEDCRAALAPRLLSDLRQDLRYAARCLRRSPGFTAAAAITLALGVGAAAAIFSAFDETLWRPLPVNQPGELVALYNYNSKAARFLSSSYPDYLDLRAQSSSLSGLAAFVRLPLNLTSGGHAERVQIEAVTPDYFDVLRLPALLGRTFLPVDDGQSVVLIGERTWRRRFASDPAILGRTLRFEDRPFVIIGVVPERFQGVNLNWGDRPEVWMPLASAVSLVPGFRTADVLHRRPARFLLLVGRRKPDVAVGRVDAEMRTLAWKFAQADPASNRDVSIQVFPAARAKFWPAYRNTVTEWLGVFGGGGALLLLLACATVSSLLVERAVGRRREIGVRLAIGGTRARLVRQLLTEGVLLSAPSFGLALLVATAIQKLLMRFPSAFGLGLRLDLHLETRVLFVAAALALLTAALLSLAPALQASKPEIASWLRSAGNAASSLGAPRLRQMLVVAQVAFSMALLVAGGLFGRSLLKAYAIDPGFRPERLLVLTFNPPADFAPWRAALAETVPRAAAGLPGVESVALAKELPLSAIHITHQVQDAASGTAPIAVDYNVVGAGYLHAAGIALAAGRDFNSHDDGHAQKAAIVNQALARTLWGRDNPIGRRLRFADRAGAEVQVVGVAGDTRVGSLWKQPEPYLYLSAQQWPEPITNLLVRTHIQPQELIPAIRRQWDALAPHVPLFEIRIGADLVNDAVAPQRLAAGLLAAFGLAALLLAAVGLYGVMAYAVARRTREIGIRIAIGARPSEVVRQTLVSAVRLAALGVLAGAAGSAALMRLVQPEIRGISPYDILTFSAVALLLITVALVAALGPAFRAARIDPLYALRQE